MEDTIQTILGLAILALGGYAIITDAINANIAWLLVDLLTPFSPLRGLYLLLN